MKFSTRRDIFLLSMLVLFVFLSYHLGKDEVGGRIVVEIDGKVFMEISKPGEYPIIVEGRRITTVVFDGKRVRVVDSNCPLRICEKMGWVGPGGEIICVPNRLVVRFKRKEFDAMSW